MKTRRSRSKSSPAAVIVGASCTLLAIYGHMGCVASSSPTGTGIPLDGGAPIDASTGSTNPTDSSVAQDTGAPVADATTDAPTASPVGDFVDSAAGYTWVNGGGACFFSGSFTIAISGSDITANPLGGNGAVIFQLKAGTTDQAVSTNTNLSVLGQPGHTCTFTKIATGSGLSFGCTNTNGGSCSNALTKP